MQCPGLLKFFKDRTCAALLVYCITVASNHSYVQGGRGAGGFLGDFGLGFFWCLFFVFTTCDGKKLVFNLQGTYKFHALG